MSAADAVVVEYEMPMKVVVLFDFVELVAVAAMMALAMMTMVTIVHILVLDAALLLGAIIAAAIVARDIVPAIDWITNNCISY